MVKWFEEEAALTDAVINVDVKDFGWKDDNGKPIEFLPIKELTNEEQIRAQEDPFLKNYPGALNTYDLSPKAQAYSILLTFRRLQKGNPNMGFSEKTLLSWGSARSGKLVKRISEALGEEQKKLEPSPSPMLDNSSEEP